MTMVEAVILLGFGVPIAAACTGVCGDGLSHAE